MPRILVVDDVPESVRLIEMVLRAEKYDVSISTTPAHGFEVMQQQPADLVIVDHNMPGMTGEAMLERVAMLWPKTARLMLTADPRIRDEPTRAYPVMHKPFKLNELREVVKQLLAARPR